jgi:hypothetical protein
MSKLRTTLTLGVVVIATLAAVAGMVMVERDAPGAWRSLIAVNAGMIVALGVCVWVMLSPTLGRMADLVEALRALARGDRHTRVNPADFAGLSEIARAVNDVGASLCENDDPNLGPIKKAPRAVPVRKPGSDGPRPSQSSGGVRRTTLEDIADAPGVGEVRPSKKPMVLPTTTVAAVEPASALATLPTPATDNARAHPVVRAPEAVVRAPEPESVVEVRIDDSVLPTDVTDVTEPPRLDADGVSEPRPSRKALKKAKKAARAQETSAPIAVAKPTPAPAPAPVEPAAPEPTSSSSSIDTIIEPAPEPELPSRDELQKLFDEFLREKRAARQLEGLDVDFEAFAETIRSESERLVAEHRCRGVRFEIAVAEGEVSLRPRLIR